MFDIQEKGGRPHWKPALKALLNNLGHVRGTPFYGPQDTFSRPSLFVSGSESRYVLPEVSCLFVLVRFCFIFNCKVS